MRTLPPPVPERQRVLELVGFRYRPSLSIFVQPDLKQVLTADFVEAAHRDDLERAVRTRNPSWVVHSTRPLSRRAATAILRAVAHPSRSEESEGARPAPEAVAEPGRSSGEPTPLPPGIGLSRTPANG